MCVITSTFMRRIVNLILLLFIITSTLDSCLFPLKPDRSSIKQKTFDPVWNETLIHEVANANTLGITVFHKAPIDDVFNANATITFEDLIARNQQDQQEFWVDLEPSGKLHVKIDLQWQGEFWLTSSYKTLRLTSIVLQLNCRNQSTKSDDESSDEQQGSTVPEPSTGCNETTCSSGERPQVYGDVFAPADFLFALSRIHLVSVSSCSTFLH